MVGKTALNKEMKHLNGAYFRTNIRTIGQTILSKQRAFIRRIIYTVHVIFFIVQRHKYISWF